MKGLKTMLLGFAFLLFALMGAILHESDFGYVLFILGSVLGLVFCLAGCYAERLSALWKRLTENQNKEK